MPQFVHLPLLLKPDGKGKLSKRDGDRLGFPVFPLLWHDPKSGETSSGYRESGYLPQAVVNFLALLGWNPGDDTEIMSMDELIRKFSFDHCSKSGAKFAYEKGKWFNHNYLQTLSKAELVAAFKPVLEAHGVDLSKYSDEYIGQVAELVKGRANLAADLWDQANFFFEAPDSYDPKAVKKRWSPDTPAQLEEMISIFDTVPDFCGPELEPAVLGWIADKGYHLGNLMNAFRLTVVGACRGPHMFDITRLLGKDEIVKRMRQGIERISCDGPTV